MGFDRFLTPFWSVFSIIFATPVEKRETLKTSLYALFREGRVDWTTLKFGTRKQQKAAREKNEEQKRRARATLTRKRSFLTPWINLGASGGPPKDPPGARRAMSERLETSRRIWSRRRLAVAGVAGRRGASRGVPDLVTPCSPSPEGFTPHVRGSPRWKLPLTSKIVWGVGRSGVMIMPAAFVVYNN